MTFPAGAHKESPLYGCYVARKSVTFVGGGTGSVGQHTLFTVTGYAQVVIVAYCSDDLTAGDSPTISVGTATVTAVDSLQAVTAFDLLNDGLMWTDDNAPSECEAETGNRSAFVAADITYDVLVSPITGGTLEWTCFWTPMSANATVVAI